MTSTTRPAWCWRRWRRSSATAAGWRAGRTGAPPQARRRGTSDSDDALGPPLTAEGQYRSSIDSMLLTSQLGLTPAVLLPVYLALQLIKKCEPGVFHRLEEPADCACDAVGRAAQKVDQTPLGK